MVSIPSCGENIFTKNKNKYSSKRARWVVIEFPDEPSMNIVNVTQAEDNGRITNSTDFHTDYVSLPRNHTPHQNFTSSHRAPDHLSCRENLKYRPIQDGKKKFQALVADASMKYAV